MPAGRPPAHSRAEFVQAAIRIADEQGLDALSMRKLADDRGVTSAAIYRYFESKADLVAAVRESLMIELLQHLPAEGPRERLFALGQAFRAQTRAHPCLAEFSTLPAMEGEMSGAIPAFILQQLRLIGLEGATLIRGFRQLESFVVGSSMFDFADAPRHLSDRLARVRRSDDPTVNALLTSESDIDADNEAAFITSFNWILDRLIAEA